MCLALISHLILIANLSFSKQIFIEPLIICHTAKYVLHSFLLILRLRAIKWPVQVSQLGKGRAGIWLVDGLQRSNYCCHCIAHVWKGGSRREDRLFERIYRMLVGVLSLSNHHLLFKPGITWNYVSIQKSVISLDASYVTAFESLKLSPQFLIPRFHALMVPLLCVWRPPWSATSGCRALSFPVPAAHDLHQAIYEHLWIFKFMN